MPQTKSAAKALRVAARRRAINDRWRGRVRQALRAVREAVAAGNKTQAEQAYRQAQKALDRAARRHVIHRNKAARKKSRLSHAMAKLPA